MAIACLRLVTFLPEPPLRSVPRFRSRIVFSTFSDAFLLYFRPPLFFFAIYRLLSVIWPSCLVFAPTPYPSPPSPLIPACCPYPFPLRIEPPSIRSKEWAGNLQAERACREDYPAGGAA